MSYANAVLLGAVGLMKSCDVAARGAGDLNSGITGGTIDSKKRMHLTLPPEGAGN